MASNRDFQLYGTIAGSSARDVVADEFVRRGWQSRSCGWEEIELRSAHAELVLESHDPILIHGPVDDDISAVDLIAAPLRALDLSFSLECYDPDGKLVRCVT